MMIRCVLLLASILFSAPAFWTQKSIGSNPVAPFTLARLDTTIAPQIHDTADSVRKYTRDRIKDSLVDIRAALPAYVRRIGDTITGPIVGTTATATPLINIATTSTDASNASAIHGSATVGAGVWGSASSAGGVGLLGTAAGGGGTGVMALGNASADAIYAQAASPRHAGRFVGDVRITGATTLASSLTGILKANAGRVSVADTSDFPTRPYLPIAAGSGSPLTGVLYGQGLNFTTTADAPITISQNLAGGFTHPFQAFNSGMVAGNQYNFDFGQSASTNNAGNFGFKYVGAGSSSNYVTLGLYGANDLMTITAAGVPKFSGLATAGFVRANASGQLSSSPPTYADLTGAVPTWNQNTTGSAAKWTTPRTLTIGATGKTIDGTGNQSWSLAEIGALAVGGTAVNSTNLGGKNWDYFVQGNGSATLGHRTTKIIGATATPSQSGFYDLETPADGPQGASWTHMIRNMHSGGDATHPWMFDIAASFGPGVGQPEGYYVRTISAGSTPGWRQLWHSANLTPAAIGALAAGGTAVNSSALGGVGSAHFVQGNGAGDYGHRTTSIELTPPDNLLSSGFYDGRMSMPSGGFWTHLIRSAHSDPTNAKGRWSFDIAANFAGSVGNGENYFVRTNTDVSWGTWRQLWHSGNLTSSTLPGGPYLPKAGVTDGSSAASGMVGERLSVSVASGSAVNINSTSATSVAYLDLPAGDWNVSGQVVATVNNVVTQSVVEACLNTSVAMISAGFEGKWVPGSYGLAAHTIPAGVNIPYRVASATRVYLVAKLSVSTANSATGYGYITATRVR